MKTTLKCQLELIQRGVENLINLEELVKKIERSISSGTPLNGKLEVPELPEEIDLNFGKAMYQGKENDGSFGIFYKTWESYKIIYLY